MSYCVGWPADGSQRLLTVDNAPIDKIDLERYLGSWYEIVRFDYSFERGMEQTKVTYTMREDGMIDIQNTGIKDGEPKEAKDKAKLTDMPPYCVSRSSARFMAITV